MRQVEEVDTLQTGGNLLGSACKSVTNTVLHTETESKRSDDAGTRVGTLEQVPSVGVGHRTRRRGLRGVTGHLGVDGGGLTDRCRSGRNGAACQPTQQVGGQVDQAGKVEDGGAVQTGVDLTQSSGDSGTDTALDAETEGDILDNADTGGETAGLVRSGGCDTAGDCGLGSSLVQGVDGGRCDSGGSGAANRDLGRKGESQRVQLVVNGILVVEVENGQALETLS